MDVRVERELILVNTFSDLSLVDLRFIREGAAREALLGTTRVIAGQPQVYG
jgi:hypothetical protein